MWAIWGFVSVALCAGATAKANASAANAIPILAYIICLLLAGAAGIDGPADEGLDVVRLKRFPCALRQTKLPDDRISDPLAARVLEWENVPEHRADAGFNRGPQQAPGAMQPGLD